MAWLNLMSETDYALLGRFITHVGAAETVLSKVWFHRGFISGQKLDPGALQRQSMEKKIAETRKLIPIDGSRADQALSLIENAWTHIGDDRHALVHGYAGFAADCGPMVINLANERMVPTSSLKHLAAWADHLYAVAELLYSDETRGMYRAEVDMPPILPLPLPPVDPR